MSETSRATHFGAREAIVAFLVTLAGAGSASADVAVGIRGHVGDVVRHDRYSFQRSAGLEAGTFVQQSIGPFWIGFGYSHEWALKNGDENGGRPGPLGVHKFGVPLRLQLRHPVALEVEPGFARVHSRSADPWEAKPSGRGGYVAARGLITFNDLSSNVLVRMLFSFSDVRGSDAEIDGRPISDFGWRIFSAGLELERRFGSAPH